MTLIRGASLTTMALLAAALAGCGPAGRVNQGQVVEFDAAGGTILLIEDSNFRDPSNPKFDVLPPLLIRVPVDKREMGPAPDPGKLLAVDLDRSTLVVFDATTQGFKTIDFTLIRRQDNVHADDPRVARVRFPVMDQREKAITIRLPKQRRIVTISVPEEMFGLPPETWRTGDEVRYYYKEPGQALRLMNITRTDVNKAGK